MREYRIYLDRNDISTLSHRHYVDRLASEFEKRSDIQIVGSIREADVVHLNYLNPFGRIRHGKESILRHLTDLMDAILRISTPIVLTEHGALQFSRRLDPRLAEFSALGRPGLTDQLKVLAQRRLAEVSTAIIAVSNWVADALQAGGIESAKLYTIHHGVSERFRDQDPTARDRFVFHLSKYSNQKNPKTILEVGSKLSVPLIVAGHRWKDNVTDVPDGVELRGYVSDEELVLLYNQASAFFFPSLYESFGLPIVEAMACGTAVVGSDCGSVPEIVGDGGVCCGPFETEAYVDVLQKLVSNPEYREELEESARSRARKFSWSRTAEKTVSVYRKAIKAAT